MAAVLADGMTVIDNAAREPEIIDLGDPADADGGAYRRRRHGTVTIEGVDGLQPTRAPDGRRPGGGRDLGVRGGDYPRGGDVRVWTRHLDLALEELRTAGAGRDRGRTGSP